MVILQTILFAFALSLDGFGAGISYGMRNIKIPKLPFFIICSFSAIATAVSMLVGNVLAGIVSYEIAHKAGAILLTAIGLWVLLQNFIMVLIPENKIYQFRFKKLGLLINILKEPAKADMDNSGSIDVNEAIFLGLALAMDALGAGFAAAMAGYSPLATPIYVASAEFLLILLGLILGKRFAIDSFKEELALLPGGLLLLLGIKKFF